MATSTHVATALEIMVDAGAIPGPPAAAARILGYSRSVVPTTVRGVRIHLAQRQLTRLMGGELPSLVVK